MQSGLPDDHLIPKPGRVDRLQDGVEGPLGSRGDTAGAHAHDHLYLFAFHLTAGQILLLLLSELAKLLEGHLSHVSISFRLVVVFQRGQVVLEQSQGRRPLKAADRLGKLAPLELVRAPRTPAPHCHLVVPGEAKQAEEE